MRTHRQAEAQFRCDTVEHRLRQTAGLRPEHEGITRAIVDQVVTLTAPGRDAEPAYRPDRFEKGVKIPMLTHRRILAVIQPGTAQTFVIELETERMNQVQGTARIGAQAYDIAGVRRYFRLKQDYVEQSENPDRDDR